MKKFKSLLERVKSSRNSNDQDPAISDPLGRELCRLDCIYEGWGSDQAAVDIIAVHGLNSTLDSWIDRDSGILWLRDLLPRDIPKTRTLFCTYNLSKSSTTEAEEIASSLLVKLATLRKDTNTEARPMIFMGHSFGCFLIKGAIAKSHQRLNTLDSGSIKLSTRVIIFFGIPVDKESVKYSQPTQQFEQDQDTPFESPLMKTLKRELRWKEETDTAFLQIRNEFTVRYFLEAAESGKPQANTNKNIPGVGSNIEAIASGKTHGGMVRFASSTDRDYMAIVAELQSHFQSLCDVA